MCSSQPKINSERHFLNLLMSPTSNNMYQCVQYHQWKSDTFRNTGSARERQQYRLSVFLW